MKSRTKRIMESTIVLAIIISCIIIFLEKKREEHLQELRPELVKMLHKAINDKYGPGDLDAYLTLFPSPRKRTSRYLNSNDYIYEHEIFSRFKPFNRECGFVSVDSSPDWFGDEFEDIETFAYKLHAALDSGPMLVSPDDPEPVYLDRSIIRSRMNNLRYLAIRHWMSGNQERAVVLLTDIFRMGDALQYCEHWNEQYLRFEMIEYGRTCFNSLLWNNPGGDINQVIYEALKKYQPADWKIPRYVSNPAWHILLDPNYTEPLDFIAAVWLLYLRPDNEISQSLSEAGITTCKNQQEVLSLLKKWTTIPAMKKRVERLPGSFFQKDTILSAEQTGHIPKILYTASRAWDRASQDKISEYLSNVPIFKNKQKAEALLAAYWARTFREEHNQWPTPEEFKSQCPHGDHLALLKVDNPQPLLLDLPKLFQEKNTNGYNAYNYFLNKVHYPDSHTIEYTFMKKAGEERQITPQEKVEIEWTSGIFKAACPMIRSVTHKITPLPRSMGGGYGMMGGMGYGMGMGGTGMEDGGPFNSVLTYTLEINPPEHSYWIADYHDEVVPPIMFLIENLQEKDEDQRDDNKPVIQLAGWE